MLINDIFHNMVMCFQYLHERLHDPKKGKLKVEFLGVPYNQTFDFVTGQFVKILTPACSWKMLITIKPFGIFW